VETHEQRQHLQISAVVAASRQREQRLGAGLLDDGDSPL